MTLKDCVSSQANSRDTSSDYSEGFGRYFLLIGVALALAIALGGWAYYQHEYAQVRQQARASLETIADLKAAYIAKWMMERRGDAEVARTGILPKQFLSTPDNPTVRQQTLQRIEIFMQSYGYAAVIFTDAKGDTIMKVPAAYQVADSAIRKHAGEALQSDKVVINDFTREATNDPILMWLNCPVYPDGETNGTPAGMVILLVDPHTFLYPTLQKWPTPSDTAETGLVRKDGDDVVCLNDLRFRTNSALNLRLSVQLNPNLPSSKAFRGDENIEATDYRGITVFAAARKIPDMPWTVIAKIDKDEVLAPLRREAWEVAIITCSLLMASMLGVAMIWRQQKLAFAQASEARLRASEERYRGLVNSMQDIIYTVSTDGKILFIGPQVQRYGFTEEDLIAKPFSQFIYSEDRAAVMNRFQYTLETGMDEMATFRVMTKAGKLVWLEEIGRPIRDGDGKIAYISGMLRDVTETRKLEEQFRQVQKMEAIGQLAGGVAHDFNNILAAMMMQTEIIGMTENLPAEVQEGLQQLRTATERAASLTRQLLLFSRKQVMQMRNVDLNEIVTNLTKMLQRLIGAQIKLQVKLHAGKLITHADVGMLDQILLNLVVNARDAMPNGGQLLIETSEKIISEEFARLYPDAKPGHYVSLGVSDTGTGIATEVMPRIFEPFFTTKDPGKGTGLGLATVFGIVKQHAGWIKVYSEVGQGTNFQIFLPASNVSPATLNRTAQSRPRGGNETILLAEDDSTLRKLTCSILERHGYRVLAASNGVEALQIWSSNQDSALLLTDIVMPGGMSGQQLARRLQRLQPKIKVIFTSGYSAEIAGRELELRKGENFLRKPCPPNELLETVRQCLDQ